MIRLFFVRLIKTLMMATPFLSMILMLSALWGVVGKTTYTDLNNTADQIGFAPPKAKNYLVNETKGKELCTTVSESPETSVNEAKSDLTNKEPLPEKIDWEHVV